MSYTRSISFGAGLISVLLALTSAASDAQILDRSAGTVINLRSPENVIPTPGYHGQPGLTFSQEEHIERINPQIASSYLGRSSFPQPNLLRLSNGHLQIVGATGSWGSQTDLVTIVANPSAGGGYGNNGNQGNFWDPSYRSAYGGQDAAALFISMAARVPIASNAAIRQLGRQTVATPAGDRIVYTITLKTPLVQHQLAELVNRPPTLRIETDNGFFAYLVPEGLIGPDGSPVPPVSADGTTLVVDNWVRVQPKPAVDWNMAALPTDYTPTATSVTIDVVHTIDNSYGGLSVTDDDFVTGATGDERVFLNDRVSHPILDLNDPLRSTLADGTSFLMMGYMAGVIRNSPSGAGVGTAYVLANEGWQAGFIARNPETSTSGPTYGLLVPSVGPNWAVYSTKSDGFLLGADPGNTGHHTVLLDNRGNLALSGNVASDSTITAPTVRANGTLSVHDKDGANQTAYIDGADGSFFSKGVIASGSSDLRRVPICTALTVGSHFYVTDARKPGEGVAQGSGVPVDCTPARKGGQPVWVSVYDHAEVKG